MFSRFFSATLLFEEAHNRGLNPEWETQDGLFSFLHNGKNIFVYYTQLHINSQLGSQICQDKSLTKAFLEREGFLVIPYIYSNQNADLNRFLDLHRSVIQKPLLGLKSHNVHLITAHTDINYSSLEDTLLEKYIAGTEYRCLVMGNTIAMQKKVVTPTGTHPWKKHVTNLEKTEWIYELSSIAEAIAAQLHMGFIAVDFIIDSAGKSWILELNSMPGLYSFHHPDSGNELTIAKELLNTIVNSSV